MGCLSGCDEGIVGGEFFVFPLGRMCSDNVMSSSATAGTDHPYREDSRSATHPLRYPESYFTQMAHLFIHPNAAPLP
jgi:hypothetical protein